MKSRTVVGIAGGLSLALIVGEWIAANATSGGRWPAGLVGVIGYGITVVLYDALNKAKVVATPHVETIGEKALRIGINVITARSKLAECNLNIEMKPLLDREVVIRAELASITGLNCKRGSGVGDEQMWAQLTARFQARGTALIDELRTTLVAARAVQVKLLENSEDCVARCEALARDKEAT